MSPCRHAFQDLLIRKQYHPKMKKLTIAILEADAGKTKCRTKRVLIKKKKKEY